MLRKHVYTLILIFFAGFHLGVAQKVGLVLSGGGAKGMTHIGVIKALEENNIPIDYVAGTSMGAIVGGMYAIGMTPHEMIELLKSKEFENWSKGKIDKQYRYFYRRPELNPSVIDLKLRVKLSKKLDSISIKPILPSNMISPVQMNFVFFEFFSKATALSNRDFNDLFIPFRSVASDIHKKKAIVAREGDLGDAVRASMTFPFMFRPIIVDKTLLFDGGIFNNFPVDVMMEDFKPEFIIGSSVAANAKPPSIDDPFTQLNAMIMNYTDYNIEEGKGILLNFDMENESLFDFTKVDDFVELGYNLTMEQMEEIKKRVSRRIDKDEVNKKRLIFNSDLPELSFKKIYVTGVDSLQEEYVRNFFKGSKNELELEDVKRKYFELIEDQKISEIIPHALYNPKEKQFDLYLNVNVNEHMKFSIGGNISSSTSNQAYVGLQYQDLGKRGHMFYTDVQFGTLYNGLGFGTHIDIPTKKNFSLHSDFVVHKFKSYDRSRVFYEELPFSFFSQLESYGKIKACFPLKVKFRFDVGIGYGFLTDFYRQDEIVKTNEQEYDKSYYSILSSFSQFKSSTLNKKMYPFKGYGFSASVKGLLGNETFKSFEYASQNVSGKKDIWLQLESKYEHYIPFSKRFILGTHIEGKLTSRRLLQNYTSTIIQMPSFEPTYHSKAVFNSAFRADKFLALGIKPIIPITSSIHFRNESYLFLPYQTINRKADNSVIYSNPFTSYQYMSETSLVFSILDVAAISVFLNYYSKGVSNWNFGVNIGCLIFRDKYL